MQGFYKPDQMYPCYENMLKHDFVDFLRTKRSSFYLVSCDNTGALDIKDIPVTLDDIGSLVKLATLRWRPKDKVMKSWPTFEEIFVGEKISRVSTSYANWAKGKYEVVVGITTT